MTDPGAVDPGAGGAQQVDGEKVGPAADDTGKVDQGMELAEGGPDGAQDYRTRVQEAQLPDGVGEAALREVDKREPTSDQGPESGDIRTGLDTMLDLPGSTKTTDWIDIQGSREVEATLRRLIEPAAADLADGDTAELEPAAADVEEGHTAEAEPAAADLAEGDTAEVEPAAADLAEGDTAEVEPAAADLAEADTAEVQAAAADLETADTAPAGPQHGDTVKVPAVPAYLAEVDSNVLNSRNSRSSDRSRFRLLRRKGALDTWRWPPPSWRRCLSAHCCSPRVEIAA